MSRLVSALAAAAVTACSLGTRARTYEPAQRGAGVTVTVETVTPIAIQGELLAADDTAVTVLSASRVWLAPYTTVRWINVRQGGRIGVGRRPPDPRDREALRLRSRFPRGLDADLLARLLAAYGRDSLDVVRP